MTPANEGMRAGLLSRLRRVVHRVEEQHRALREVAKELDRALAAGARNVIHVWLTRMHDGLDAHFELEEDVLFPALHGLDAETQAEIEQLEREHGRFLSDLEAMLGHAPAAPDVEGLRERLAAHERKEEQLLDRALGEEDG